MAGLIGLFAWTPWDGETRERELDWLASVSRWTYLSDTPRRCETQLQRVVGEPPTARLEPVHAALRRGCEPGRWGSVVWDVEGSLIESHREEADPVHDPELSRVASSIAETTADTHCWERLDWTNLAEQFDALGSGEFWLAGLAVPDTGRIDLSPDVCVPVRRFLFEGYAPHLSFETFELSQALVVFAHEAEHLRSPTAGEDETECHALQRVRGLVRDVGHGEAYADELAGLAWDIGYPEKSDAYRTELCYDGGPLDLHRQSSIWP
jgi:hypothetical protein